MDMVWILAIAVILLIWLGFKWNNMRTRIAFFFILFGALFLLLIFFMSSGRLNFSDLGQTSSSLKGYFLTIKGFAIKVFEATGKVIGRFSDNSTG